MTIEEEIARICSADNDQLARLSMNQIADLYRGGAELQTLVPLLAHPNPQVVQCGVWVASEVVRGDKGREIFRELVQLLAHPDAAVRFWAIESVALLVRPEDQAVVEQLLSLATDINPGVRGQALYWICWIPDSSIASLQEARIGNVAKLLLATTTKDEIRQAIRSKDQLRRRMAIAGLLRNFASNERFIQELQPSLDEEVLSSIARVRAFPPS